MERFNVRGFFAPDGRADRPGRQDRTKRPDSRSRLPGRKCQRHGGRLRAPTGRGGAPGGAARRAGVRRSERHGVHARDCWPGGVDSRGRHARAVHVLERTGYPSTGRRRADGGAQENSAHATAAAALREPARGVAIGFRSGGDRVDPVGFGFRRIDSVAGVVHVHSGRAGAHRVGRYCRGVHARPALRVEPRGVHQAVARAVHGRGRHRVSGRRRDDAVQNNAQRAGRGCFFGVVDFLVHVQRFATACVGVGKVGVSKSGAGAFRGTRDVLSVGGIGFFAEVNRVDFGASSFQGAARVLT